MTRWTWAVGGAFVTAAIAAAETPTDPRVGLKPGYRDAGTASRHLELVANVPRPPGFFNPAAPAGEPSPPERREGEQAEPRDQPDEGEPEAGGAEASQPRPRRGRRTALDFANSDLAFQDHYVFVGSFHGFNIYDIRDPRHPRLVTSVVCPGGQGDLSVYGHLLFMSVEEPRGRVDCGTQGVQGRVSAERFRGVRIFDISDLTRPRQVAAVQTCRGSHTHTLVVDPDDQENVYIYGSGTSSVRPGEELAGCSRKDPKEDPETSLYSIDVIQVPLAAPERARIVNRPRIFADPQTGAIAGLWPGGDHGPGTQRSSATNQCHDITVFPAAGLAAGACAGNGILLDISDPVHPVRLDAVQDPNFAYWHSATFNNDGTKVIFTDEWGGGTRPRCRATDPTTWGADAIFDIVDRKLRFRSYYKLPAPQTEQENCVAHNGSIVPVPGRDIMVQGWYQGGISVFDFTDSERPVEIAFFDRGPVDAKQLIVAGHWSAYWYNGYIYATEIARGLDIFRLTPGDQLSASELAAAALVRFDRLNTQHQPRIEWPAAPAVARAYLDQLVRSGAVAPARARAIGEAIDRAGRGRPDPARRA
ncbi:MAG TPA: hypothetical protein VNI83_00190, partial [Vicinamibacterales bacterium]|nr:hypothetical protein [Vicinamibacterales bacterium]